ncbi:MAG: TldD/PmbA family protein [candidate division WOR-3 bacterium]
MEDKILSLARRRGADAEVFAERTTITRVTFQTDQGMSVNTKVVAGYGLRVIHRGRIGFAATSNPARPELVVDAALEACRLGATARFEFPPAQPLPGVRLFNNRLALQPVELMIASADEIIELARARLPGIQLGLNLEKRVGSLRVINTSGLDCSLDKTDYHLGLVGATSVGNRLISTTESANLSSTPAAARQAVERLIGRLSSTRQEAHLTPGRYPVIFAGSAVPSLLGPLFLALNGITLAQGRSPLADKEDEPVLDHNLTIFNDGLQDFGLGSAPFDGEGTPRRRLTLVENGVLKNFLLDLTTAAQTGRQTTGCAQRDYRNPPQPGLSNLVIEPGAMQLATALANIKEGLIVYEAEPCPPGDRACLETDESVRPAPDATTGDFVLTVKLGLKVEQGEFTGWLSGPVLSGNIFRLGRDLVGIGARQDDLLWALVPFLHVSDVAVEPQGKE